MAPSPLARALAAFVFACCAATASACKSPPDDTTADATAAGDAQPDVVALDVTGTDAADTAPADLTQADAGPDAVAADATPEAVAADTGPGATADAPDAAPADVGPLVDIAACTSGDTCSNGKCGATTIQCDDSKVCTSDSCDKIKGCVHVQVANGVSCGSGKACSNGECL